MIKYGLTLFLCVTISLVVQCQDPYVYPTDPQVAVKLNQWESLKFGLFMHWGTYSQWGVVESWSICNEDEDWCKRRGPYAGDYHEYKKQYENLISTFKPTQFAPEKWARAAKNAGMKYVVFTTKHHDGFCMYDTKLTDYKITSSRCPAGFDATDSIVKTFRKEDFFIGLYFSKPDWHCESYWWPYFATPDRNVNYNPEKYPEKWQQYKDFTYGQIQELTSNYGTIDMLWLDGGWIRPKQLKNPSWVNSPFNQDIDMKSLAALARKNQPGLLIVDRSVGGEFENYQTPEQHIPSQHEILPYPWETCMTMGNSWSYVPNDQYKSSKTILNNLCTVVSRGGNYLLNIGPSPNGDWDIQAYQKLEEIAEWMKVNERAIFNTTRAKISESEHYFYTQKNDTVFAIFFSDSLNQFPTHFPIEWPQKPGLVQLLGGDFPVNYEWIKEGMTWTISKSDRSKLQNLPAICFYFIPEH